MLHFVFRHEEFIGAAQGVGEGLQVARAPVGLVGQGRAEQRESERGRAQGVGERTRLSVRNSAG
ncbi:MAG: hypothetical protein ACK4NB_00950 [Fimbriimonadales bacterium]